MQLFGDWIFWESNSLTVRSQKNEFLLASIKVYFSADFEIKVHVFIDQNIFIFIFYSVNSTFQDIIFKRTNKYQFGQFGHSV